MNPPTEMPGAEWLDWMDQELAQAQRPDGQKTAFEVLLIGEGPAALARAEELCLCLAIRFVHEITFEGATLTFAALADPECRAEAARDVAAAKMILLSFGDALRLPVQVEGWIQSLPTAPHARALVALFAQEHETTAEALEICDRLRSIGAKTGMDFLSNTVENLDRHAEGITVRE